MTIRNYATDLMNYANTGTLEIASITMNGTTLSPAVAGTVDASTMVIPDSNKDISGFRNFGATGTATLGVIAATTLGVSGHTSLSEGAKTAGTTQTQAGATALTSTVTVGTTGNANDGYVLPAMTAGKLLILHNASSNAGKVYANGTETLNGTAGNAGSTALTASKTMLIFGTGAGTSVSAVMM